MGRYLNKSCEISQNTMRGDNLKRHMNRHEKKPYSIDEAETHRSGTCGEMNKVDQAQTHMIWTSSAKCTNINFEKLRRECIAEGEEFNRKIELGRQLKIIINGEDLNIHALSANKKDALLTYLTEITQDSCREKIKMEKKMVIESDESEDDLDLKCCKYLYA